MRRIGRALVALGLVVALALSSCKDDPPKSTRWDEAASAAAASAQAAASAAASAPPPPKTETGSLNAFFPKDQADVHVVFTADRPGYAEAKLVGEAGVTATLTIADADAAALQKFDAAKEKLGTMPLVTVGKNQSAVLAGARQAKITSPTLDAEARKAWLAKFDLTGLAALPPPAASTPGK